MTYRLELRDAAGNLISSTVALDGLRVRLGLLWDALDALRRDFDRTGEHDRANSILAAQEHVEELQREVGGL